MSNNALRDEAVKLLAQLVSFDTTSSNPNRACIDFIARYLKEHGVASTIVPNDDEKKASLWATLGPQGTNGVILAGHTDVVPVTGQQWTSDPFTLTERDGRLYARGACDMKGFIACVLAVLPSYVSQTLTIPIHLAFTHDEETDMSGASRLTAFLHERGLKPDWVWIGEPTSLHMIDSHKGVAAFKTSFKGIPGHSGQPDKGLNAIDLGIRFASFLQEMAAEKRKSPYQPSRFDPPYTTLNLGRVQGGTGENIIAEDCDILWQVRTHPGDDLDSMLGALDERVARDIKPRFQSFLPTAGMSRCTCCNIPPLLPTAENKGVHTLARLTGRDQVEAVSFATEGGFFQKLGTSVVICGPGRIDEAHKGDEYVEKSQLSACCDILGQFFDEKVAKESKKP